MADPLGKDPGVVSYIRERKAIMGEIRTAAKKTEQSEKQSKILESLNPRERGGLLAIIQGKGDDYKLNDRQLYKLRDKLEGTHVKRTGAIAEIAQKERKVGKKILERKSFQTMQKDLMGSHVVSTGELEKAIRGMKIDKAEEKDRKA